MLVDTLVDCEWLLRRFRRVEGQMWEDPNFKITFAKAFRHDSDHFARLQRHIDATQRNYRNALHELQRLQAEHPVEPEPEPAPVISRNQTLKPPNGFVPQIPAEPPANHPPNPAPPQTGPLSDE